MFFRYMYIPLYTICLVVTCSYPSSYPSYVHQRIANEGRGPLHQYLTELRSSRGSIVDDGRSSCCDGVTHWGPGNCQGELLDFDGSRYRSIWSHLGLQWIFLVTKKDYGNDGCCSVTYCLDVNEGHGLNCGGPH